MGESKPRVFSGVQPSGELHLGNYLGAIKNWVDAQDDFANVFCVVDLHAITVPQDPVLLPQNSRRVANTYLAAGIDPERSTIFIQSHVPQHAELTWILNCIAYFGELRRMTQFKDKSGKNQETVGVGLFDYPVLMAADILLYDTNFVPVGEDQRQHVELARDLAQRFNSRYGETLVVPAPLIRETGGRIMGLDNPLKKMSKSASTPNNYISLGDPPEAIRKKIARAVTDSGAEVQFAAEKPAVSNLLTIFSLVSGRAVPNLETEYATTGYARFKRDLAEAVITCLAPFQERLAHLEANPDYTEQVLREGADRARVIAGRVLSTVKARMGLG